MSKQIAWLIEAPGHHYLSVTTIGTFDGVDRHFEWSPNPNKALRFQRKLDADDVLFALRTSNHDLFSFDRHLGPAVATELQWEE